MVVSPSGGGCRSGGLPSPRQRPGGFGLDLPCLSAPNHLPPRRAGSTREQTAPLEVGRSSSQSALSERPGRWNGRVERGAESARKRDCSHGDCPPTLVGLRGGRLSPTANLSYEPPSPRDARPVHLGPSPSVHRPTRLTRPLAGAGSQASPPGRRASSERGAGARDLLSKPACRRMRGRSETFPAVGMAALPPLTGPRTGSRRWCRGGRSRRRTGSRRSCGGRRSRRAAGRRNA